MKIIKKKFIKNIFIQKILAILTASYIFLVKITSRIQYKNESIPEEFWKNKKPFILAFWHSQLMMISFSWKSKNKINVLASGHSDGRFGAIVGSYFNLNNIPTYSKGGKFYLRQIFKKLKKSDYIGITPDGPRGPKEEVSEGIIKIAQKSKTPIIACGYWSSKNFKLKSWDSFLITLPFAKCCFVWQDPVYIPEKLNDNQHIEYQSLIKRMIDDSINKAKNSI